MKKFTTIMLFTFCFFGFFAKCKGPFDYDDIKERQLTGSYFLTFFNKNASLIYKQGNDLHLIGTGNEIFEDVDSIATYSNFIFGHSRNFYFLFDTINRTNQKCVEKKQLDLTLKQLGINENLLQPLNILTNQ